MSGDPPYVWFAGIWKHLRTWQRCCHIRAFVCYNTAFMNLSPAAVSSCHRWKNIILVILKRSFSRERSVYLFLHRRRKWLGVISIMQMKLVRGLVLTCWLVHFFLHPVLTSALSVLQRQVAGEVQTQPHDRHVNQIAMMLAIMGLGLSYYSAKQMTEQAHPAPWTVLWSRTVGSEGDGVREGAETWRWTRHSHRHTQAVIFWIPHHHVQRFQGCCSVFSLRLWGRPGCRSRKGFGASLKTWAEPPKQIRQTLLGEYLHIWNTTIDATGP